MNGRIALVTGGSRGIGAACARELATRGATVVIGARGREATEALAEELRAGGAVAHAVRLDVGTPEGIAAGLAEAAEKLEGATIDVLVNNAGIAESAPMRDGEDLSAKLMEVNFHGARRLSEALVPAMLEAEGGAIVNVASSAGLAGYPYVSAYCASKFALVGYGLALAEELDNKRISVNAVCPHYVETSMLERSIQNVVTKTGMTWDESRKTFEEMNPGGRLVQPDEVARVVCDLAEGDATACLVELDGSDPIHHFPNQRRMGWRAE